MDEAAVRRGVPSANAAYGNTVAILTGDYLFARASEIVADLGPEAVRLQASTFARLVRGQIRETAGPGEQDPVLHYLDVLADKTGSLIATSARFGAWMAGAPQQHVDIVTRFGEAIGVAFQLADDVIDVASDRAESGKTPGTDLREGVPTLPSLYAARSLAPADARLRDLLSGPVAEQDIDEALALLRAHPALAESRREVRRWADLAREHLLGLPNGPARLALLQICDSVVSRTS
jgi:heptaprenyl diphosphate synthase